MAQIDFYQLSRDPVERIVPVLTAKAVDAGARLLVVHEDDAARTLLSESLWARESHFLANGDASAPHAGHQPVLLSASCEAVNGARIAILADGDWREEAGAFDRAILLFAPEQTDAARGLWSRLSGGDHTLRIFKQSDSGGWREGR